MSEYETGVRNSMSADAYYRLAQAYGVTIEHLMGLPEISVNKTSGEASLRLENTRLKNEVLRLNRRWRRVQRAVADEAPAAEGEK